MKGMTLVKARRVQYLVASLRIVNDASVRKVLGIQDKKYKDRLITALLDHGSLDNKPGQGRPPSYTEDQLEAARDALLQGDTYYFSAAELVAELMELEVLAADTSVKGFMWRLKGYLLERREMLAYGLRRLTFAMTEAHCQGRLAWCLENRKKLTQELVKQYTFQDEIVIDCGGKPKGKSSF